MLRIGAAENRDLDARAGNFGDGDIAARTARIVREGRRHDRDAASALGKTQQRGAKMASPGMTVLAARLATAEIGRAHVRTPVTNAHLVSRLLLAKKQYNLYHP